MRCKTWGARVLPPNSPRWCSPKSVGYGDRLRANRGGPVRRHPRVVGAGEAAAPHVAGGFRDGRVRILLIGQAFEVGGATSADQHALIIVLAIDQVAQHFLVLRRGDVREFFAAARTDHEEHIEDSCAELMRPLNDRRQLLIVHRLRAEMDLELKAVPLAGFNPGHSGFPGSRNATERIVFGGIERIDADADAHDADLDEGFGHLVVDEHAVGPEDHHEAELHRMAGDVENVGTDQRLSACNDQQTALIHDSDLIDERIALFSGELVVAAGRFGGGIEVAVIALEIAALCQIERNEIRLEVIDGPAVVHAFALRRRGHKLRDLLLKRPERSLQRGEAQHRERFTHQLAPDFEPVRLAIMSLRLPVFMASAM